MILGKVGQNMVYGFNLRISQLERKFAYKFISHLFTRVRRVGQRCFIAQSVALAGELDEKYFFKSKPFSGRHAFFFFARGVYPNEGGFYAGQAVFF